MPISICHWNINGNISCKSIDSSFASTIEKFDIVFLSETHLFQDDYFDPGLLGFSICYRNDRTCSNKRSGGVLVLVKSHLVNRIKIYQNIEGQEQIFVCLDNSIVIGGVYIPPRPNKIDIDERFSILSDSVDEIQSSGLPLLLFGDFNARIGDSNIILSDSSKTSHRIRNLDKVKNKSGGLLRSLISTHLLKLLNGSVISPAFTSHQRSGSSMIDMVLCSNNVYDCICNGKTHEENLYSDHCPVSIDFITYANLPLPMFQSDVPASFEPKFSRRAVQSIQRNSLKLIDFGNDVDRDVTITRVYNTLDWAIENHICVPKHTLSILLDDAVKAYKRILYEYAGYKSSTRLSANTQQRNEPWVDDECKAIKREFRRLQAQNRIHRNLHNRLRNAKKRYKSVWKRKRMAYERQYLDSLFFVKDPRELWSIVQNKKKTAYSGPVSLQSFTDHLAAIANGKFECSPELLEKCRIYNRIRSERIPSKSSMNAIIDRMADPDIEMWDMGSNRAPGSDGLTGEMLRIGRCNMCFVFEKFMLCFFLSGESPSLWDCDIKVGILKPGKSGHNPSDLRPITLVNTLTKVYERFLLSILKEHFCTDECQAGFKSGYSCIQRVFSLSHLIRWSLDCNRRKLYCIFIDFSSFFDTVQTEILIDYLYKNNVPPSLCRAIHGMFKNLSAKAKLHNRTGSSFDVRVGIRQGSVISPFLGTAYLQQISDALSLDCQKTAIYDNDVGHILYADDMVLYSHDIDLLQTTINKVSTICKRIGLNINTDKTFWTVFHMASKPRGLKDILIDGKVIEYESSPKYLGVTISDKLDFKNHISFRSQKADRAFSSCINFHRRFSTVRFPLILSLYERLVIPSLLYGCEIYGWKLADQIDHRFYVHMKRYFSLPQHVSKPALYWALGVTPLHYLIWEKCYKFWLQLLHLPSTRLEKSSHEISKSLHEKMKKSWFGDMLDDFELIGFQGDFVEWDYTQALNRFPDFLAKTKRYLVNDMKNTLTRRSSKYSFLILVFPELKKRHFLEYTTRAGSRVFLRILLSIHKFEIETGRHSDTDRLLRFCVHCAKTRHWVIGDENHHICDCPRHQISRNSCCDSMSIRPSQIVPAMNCSIFVTASMYKRFSILCKYLTTILHEVNQ